MRPRPRSVVAPSALPGLTDRTEIVDRITRTGGDADGHAKAGVVQASSLGLLAASDAPVRDTQERRISAALQMKGGHMPTEAKQAAVAELVELLKETDTAIVSDHRGLTVADLLKVRRELRAKDIQYRIIKLSPPGSVYRVSRLRDFISPGGGCIHFGFLVIRADHAA